jgi:hypothetical protein
MPAHSVDTLLATSLACGVSGPRGFTSPSASATSPQRPANCILALALGFLGSRWHRPELVWVAYTAVAFGTLKLLFEDLRFGNPTSLVVSLLFYGLILILLPRLTKRLREAA